MQQNPLAALALFIRKFGEKIDGGWEIFVSAKKLQELGDNAQIQVEPIPARRGFKFKVFFNKTTEGMWGEINDINSNADSSSGPSQLTETNEPQ